ncbi:MAG: hypothetical protein CBD91_05160 [Phycisphaeraceae bacterium TMED231]|nr:MAG: hypothetical protein CBD91_05160 [Phycisphaeraceae bacterium TMED231]
MHDERFIRSPPVPMRWLHPDPRRSQLGNVVYFVDRVLDSGLVGVPLGFRSGFTDRTAAGGSAATRGPGDDNGSERKTRSLLEEATAWKNRFVAKEP